MQRSARKLFYSPSGQQGLLFPVQKPQGEVGKQPHPTSSHRGIGKNTVGEVNNTMAPINMGWDTYLE